MLQIASRANRKLFGKMKEEACAFMDTTEAEYNAYKQLVERSAGSRGQDYYKQ